MNRYQDGHYLAFNPSWHEEDSDWKARKIVHLLRRAGAASPRTIAEVGCGTGGILIASDYPSRLVDRPRTASEWIFWLPRKIGAMIHPELSARIFGGTSLLVLGADQPESSG